MAKTGRKSVGVGKLDPKILIFDVDGVLVDVRETYWRSGLQTIQQLTGKKPTWAQFHEWKRMPGNNDDWRMVSRWATALGSADKLRRSEIGIFPVLLGEGRPTGKCAAGKTAGDAQVD